jgi:cyclic lactone autoinducer peptide
MKKKLAEVLSGLALKFAKSAAGAASDWSTYQPKEPDKLKELLK